MRWPWFSRAFLVLMGSISICQKIDHTQKQLWYNTASLKAMLNEKVHEWKKQHKHTASLKNVPKRQFFQLKRQSGRDSPRFSRNFQDTQSLFVLLKTSPRSFSNRNWWRVITFQRKDWAEARLWRLLNSLLLTQAPLSKLYLSINIYT